MISTIEKNCSRYLKESNGRPLYKYLPDSYGFLKKVKVRKKKKTDEFIETFNNALGDENLRQRAVFAYADKNQATVEASFSRCLYFIFPVDRYDFLYNPNVKNSEETFKQNFMNLTSHGRENIIMELLQDSYQQTNLEEGMKAGAEIIFYKIPCYYAVKYSLVDSYSQFLNM